MTTANFSDLFSVLFYCFLIILFGYAAGRFNLITSTQSQGIGSFIGIFALPALLFKSMVELNFSKVSWTLLLAIFLAKAILFISVFAIAVFVSRRNGIGIGGLYGIFVTQSNDFAIGYPIVHALYYPHFQELLQYIYLVAPISLLIINPFGFLCMEIDKQWKKKKELASVVEQENISEAGPSSVCDTCPSSDVCRDRTSTSSSIESPEEIEGICKILLRAVFRLLLNPIVFMVFIGFAFHFIFNGTLPRILKPLVDTLSNAFSATALFYLGLTMVGKIEKQAGVRMLVPGMLIVAKILLLPILMRQILVLLSDVLPIIDPHTGQNGTDINGTLFGNMTYTTILENYAFLYGTLPTAPTVVIYAAKYGLEVDRIASAMVVCTTLSAPIMYVGAWTLTIPHMDYQFYESEIAIIAQDSSIVGMLASLWCVLVFVLSKKFQRIPHLFTLVLTSAMFLASFMSVISSFALKPSTPDVNKIVAFFFMFVGVNSSRLFTASLAISLVLLKYKGETTVRRHQWLLISVPLLLSIIVAVVLIIVEKNSMSSTATVWMFGTLQEAVSFTTILLSLATCMTSLILLFRLPNLFDKQRTGTLANPENNNEEERDQLIGNEELENVSDSSSVSEEEDEKWLKYATGDPQIGRHVSLLILLCISLLIGVVLTGWRLTKLEESGIYFEFGFLDAVFNFGQALFVLLVFGFDEELIIDPLMQIWYRLRGAKEIPKVNLSELDQEVLRHCHVFVKHHLENCKKSLLHNKRHGLNVYKDVVTGSDFCTWLVEVGLAVDRKEAVHYGQHLLNARLLRHVTNRHDFYDKSFLYQFESRRRADGTVPVAKNKEGNLLKVATMNKAIASKSYCVRRKCKLGPKQYSFERYLKSSEILSTTPYRLRPKLRKRRDSLKSEGSYSSDRSICPDVRSGISHPLVSILNEDEKDESTVVTDDTETETSLNSSTNLNVKDLTDW